MTYRRHRISIKRDRFGGWAFEVRDPHGTLLAFGWHEGKREQVERECRWIIDRSISKQQRSAA